jgi:hypothetical protein
MPRTVSFVNHCLGIATLVALILGFGCAGEDDPVVISLQGRTVHLSKLIGEYDRIKGPGAWAGADVATRKAFADVNAKKELLLAYTAEHYGAMFNRRAQSTFDRWLGSQIGRRYGMGVRESIALSPQFVDSLAATMTEERAFLHITCRDVEDAQEIYSHYQAGGDFETVAEEHAARSPETIKVAPMKYMDHTLMPVELAEALFALEAPGQVAPPCETQRFGWSVVRLDSVRTVDVATKVEAAQVYAEKTYRTDKIQQHFKNLSERYAFEVVADDIDVIGRRFSALFDSVNVARSEGHEISYHAIPPPIHRFTEEELSRTLVRWNGGSWTLREYLDSLLEVDLDFWPTSSGDRLKGQILRRMYEWMVRQEAVADGLLEEPEFAGMIQRKREQLMLDQLYYEQSRLYGRQISDEEIRSHWEEHKNDYRTMGMVGYGFIRFPEDAEELAHRTSEELSSGTPWVNAAQNARRTDPRVEFIPMLDPTDAGTYPELTELAKAYDPRERGPVYSEPLQSGAEWFILRVYYRSVEEVVGFDTANTLVRRDLEALALEDSLVVLLGSLEQHYSLQINEEALQ